MRNKLLLTFALICAPAFAETRAYWSYLDQNLLSMFPGGGIYKEHIQVFVNTDDTRVLFFKITISYVDSEGTKQVRTQTIDRQLDIPNYPSLALFYASRATSIKLMSVLPLTVSNDPVVVVQ